MEPIVLYMDEYLSVWAGDADRTSPEAYVVGHGHVDNGGTVTLFVYGPGPTKDVSAAPVDVAWPLPPASDVPF